ncbi:3-isopropylmalate dehydratase [Microbacterium immunditiarum]|uniref:3-isopropylmalate dehydratase small subunit n=1 Tax=Microbacterium immunditiarum TaxID=337480 RepID=A0A7Y9GMR2_9MICO|nr:3-isopropylmalate dehydratase [Microbacterium immunditiarum]NYE19272.1 3-isopropylmalate/(R)-2-methylmalate dehydratase small subunit [Microbacterium immunditiarum]
MTGRDRDWVFTGRARVFADDDINTDQIMPRRGFELPPEEQSALVLDSIRPGWAATVRSGDILVAGRRFGCGSSRPAPLVLARTGIAAVVAESLGDIFLRNAVAYAVPVLEAPGVLGAVSEGDELDVDIARGAVTNLTTGSAVSATPLPPMLLDTIAAGGVHALLRRDGYLAPIG